MTAVSTVPVANVASEIATEVRYLSLVRDAVEFAGSHRA